MSNVLTHYQYLHSIPEPGFEEVKTSAYLAEKLTEYRQISDRFVQMAGKRTSGTDFAPEQVE